MNAIMHCIKSNTQVLTGINDFATNGLESVGNPTIT